MQKILQMMLNNYSDRYATIYHDEVVKDIKKLDNKVDQLLKLYSHLKTCEDVDWSDADPNWEFMRLSKTLEQILDIPEDCENFTSYGECSSIDNGPWHKETQQQIGDDYYVHCDWDIQENGVAIDCYAVMGPNDLTYLWLHGAGWTDDLVQLVMNLKLYIKHPVYLIEDRGYILCGDKVYYILDKGLIPDKLSKIGKMFDFEGCIGTVHCLCEGGE